MATLYCNDNCVVEATTEVKKAPFNAMTKACAENLFEAEAEANRILGLLDTTEKKDDLPKPEVNDFRMALDLNVVLSRRIAETLTHIVTILEG